jgi:hypothetical protein
MNAQSDAQISVRWVPSEILPLRGRAEEDEHADESRSTAERQGPGDIAPAHADPADHGEEGTDNDQDESTGKERKQAIADGGSSHNETDEPSGQLAASALSLIRIRQCMKWRRTVAASNTAVEFGSSG